ncbi:tRNA nucleotidyltransferase [Haloarcula marismortui ATCC 43049]|uniref:CCA-adding enzyme n=2 Tax=Haloarcula marismortui (strain ATCC 43049 / DSM 3752 / JCM 8966 / VKM B-1809) TaxID=272569 RepID=CCA_HALMA|nr:CCA tRNA nucleotidyltransferase [Haloarcula marismortui]Q5V030.1 RecName: Full=CCA-adding enzyme; AltName: Full=CCA tRNA nucleotidyltransferase; AltName: Full=tRNA CCA-pyrophosphorylase; AltName: Full=tRNA adenylyl-/cytidylyl- transferase; AltName: Full=tRNA nucleotidyltransferase; AltName: Full=tRNA-NT [Haloarcula marismortui ATCC 43049]AAV47123.1 tRNA nucleotidyltransferase [Haloarcula marismortui ATCC 43049]QCP91827.1 CCA tRNA nucleotidyltransferase [Haloarcula marismortui ATCC 43049]
MSDEFDAVVGKVRARASPTDDERAQLQRVADAVMADAEAAIADLPVEAEVVQVGSTARGTWTAGDRDVDVFVCFPPSIDREALEEYGLAVGHDVLPDGREEYAEHPYVVGEREGYAVDLVPCYAVENATEIQSAVDRTPFHTRYLQERLDDNSAAEVRVAKQFLKGIGVYGSDLRTRGFSGYLTELLVLEFGGFRAFLEAVADWHPPVRLDPDDHGSETFDDPLVVIDPTDPERNVAAVLSETNVATLQHYARDLLAEPRVSLFTEDDPCPFEAADVEAAVSQRGTTPVALRFAAPDVVDDQLWPQLRKSLDGLCSELDRRGFEVLRSAAFVEDDSGKPETLDTESRGRDVVLLLEFAVAEQPAVERHEGPPVHVREHASGFFQKYDDNSEVAGPFIDGDRYVVERQRAFTTATGFLSSAAVYDVGLGQRIESALENGYEVLVGTDIAALADGFGVDLASYFDPKP